jgi:hypothetical protein
MWKTVTVIVLVMRQMLFKLVRQLCVIIKSFFYDCCDRPQDAWNYSGQT